MAAPSALPPPKPSRSASKWNRRPANGGRGKPAHDVLTAIEGILLGDKGYIRPQFKAECEAIGIDLPTPMRQNMTEHRPQGWLRLLRRLRKRIETVIRQLEQQFWLARLRARDAWQLTNRGTRALWAHTVGVAFNLRLGRSPLDLDNLLVN